MSDASDPDDHSHAADFASGTGYEPDLSDRTAGIVLGYIGVLTVMFFVTLFALVPYFKWEAEREHTRKVFTAESAELKQLRADEAAKLGGKDHITVVAKIIKNGQSVRIEVENGVIQLIGKVAAAAAGGAGGPPPGAEF